MNSKIQVLVHIDLEGAKAWFRVRGEVTTHSVQALYVLARRANSLVPGVALILDISRAWVAPAALEALHSCSVTAHLPARIDPFQSECQLTIVNQATPPRSDVETALAA